MSEQKVVYNNYHEKTRPKRLGRNEVVTYRIAGTYDPASGKGRLISAIRIPPRDTIYDPIKEDYVDIALVDRQKPNGEVDLMNLWITQKQSNLIVLSGKKLRDQKIHEYFELTDFNGSKEDRDPSKPIIFEKVDEIANARTLRATKQKSRDAVAVVQGMSDEEVKQYFVAKGGDVNKDVEILRMKLEDIAEKNPDIFLAGGFDKSDQMMANLKNAAKKGVISYDKETGAWSWKDGAEICTIEKGVGVSQYAELLKFVTGSDSGQLAYRKIEESLK